MEVDSIRGAKMRINFDVTFPSTPCAGESIHAVAFQLESANLNEPLPRTALSLDAMDASGSHQLDILHDIFKSRLDPCVSITRYGVALHQAQEPLRCADLAT